MLQGLCTRTVFEATALFAIPGRGGGCVIYFVMQYKQPAFWCWSWSMYISYKLVCGMPRVNHKAIGESPGLWLTHLPLIGWAELWRLQHSNKTWKLSKQTKIVAFDSKYQRAGEGDTQALYSTWTGLGGPSLLFNLECWKLVTVCQIAN